MYKKISVQYRQDVPKSTWNIQAKLLENSRANIVQEFNFKQFHRDMVVADKQKMLAVIDVVIPRRSMRTSRSTRS